MTTARRIFKSRMLYERYGVLGRIAGGYIKAGYDVRDINPEEGVFIAVRRGERLLVKAVWSIDTINDSILDELRDRADKFNAKPVLVVYGRKPRVSSVRGLIESIKARGISYRRVRAS